MTITFQLRHGWMLLLALYLFDFEPAYTGIGLVVEWFARVSLWCIIAFRWWGAK